GAAAAPAQDEQRERIQEQINPDANRRAFSAGIGAQADAIRNGQDPQPAQDTSDPAPKTTRTRRAAPAPEPAGETDAVKQVVADFAMQAGSKFLRLKAVEIAAQAHMVANYDSTADLFATADEVLEYINKAA